MTRTMHHEYVDVFVENGTQALFKLRAAAHDDHVRKKCLIIFQ